MDYDIVIDFNFVDLIKKQYKKQNIDLKKALEKLNICVIRGIITETDKKNILTELGVEEIPVDTLREIKIEEMRKLCNEKILAGFYSSCLGVEKHFDCTMEDQATVQGLCQVAMMKINGLTTEPIKWKASGELECYEWTEQQMLDLGIDMKRHINSHIDRFNELRLYILDSNRTLEELESLTWDTVIS